MNLEILKKYPSRFLLRLGKGDPEEEMKSMLGVYNLNIAAITEDVKMFMQPKATFYHESSNSKKFCFSNNGWKLFSKEERMMNWQTSQQFFQEEAWQKQNGTQNLNFNQKKYSLHLTS